MISLDPLSGHSDPRLYVSLDSGESALAALSMGLSAGCSPALLTGPTGIGKTLLLRVLAEREWKAFPRMRFSPLLSPVPEEIAGCLLHLLFGKPSPNDPEAAEVALLKELHLPGDRRTLLLVDNIHRATNGAIRKLVEIARASAPALAVVVAGTNGEDLHALIGALAPGLTVSLPESLPDSEIEALYDAIAAHPGLSQRLRHRLANASRAEIIQVAAGLPRLLKSELARRNQDSRAPERELPNERALRRDTIRAPAPRVTEPAAQTLRGPVARNEPEPSPRSRLHLVPAAAPEVRATAVSLVSPVMVRARSTLPLLALLTLGSAVSGAGAAAQRLALGLVQSAGKAVTRSISRLWEAVVAAHCAARVSLESGRARVTRVQRVVTGIRKSAAEAGQRSAWKVLDSLVGAVRDASAPFARGYANVTRAWTCLLGTARRAGFAARRVPTTLVRSVNEAASHSSHRLIESVEAASDAIGVAARTAISEAHAESRARLRSTTEAVRSVRDGLLAGARERGTRTSHGIGEAARRTDALVQRKAGDFSRSRRHAVDRGRARLAESRAATRRAGSTLLAGAKEHAKQAWAQVRTTVGEGTKRSSDTVAQVGRAFFRAAPVAGGLAAALLAVGLLALGARETRFSRLASTPLERSEAVTLAEASVRPASRPVNVQVNARPWAQVRINGVDVGPTPLVHPLAPGVYRLEAEFPNGQRIERKIDVGPERRFVSLP